MHGSILIAYLVVAFACARCTSVNFCARQARSPDQYPSVPAVAVPTVESHPALFRPFQLADNRPSSSS